MTVGDAADEQATVEQALNELLAAHDPAGDIVEFLGARFDAGLAWVWFPVGLGGLGLPRALQGIVDDRMQAVSASNPAQYNALGAGMGAHVLLAHGTEGQQRRWLRPMFTTEEIWCQMFSEPGAGSDVAALACRAIRDGDEWVVNGQKVWTTLAHVAKWGMLVVRSDPDVPKHRGMSYFMIDMESAGVEVRPLRQITGEAEFAELWRRAWIVREQLSDADEFRVELTLIQFLRTLENVHLQFQEGLIDEDDDAERVAVEEEAWAEDDQEVELTEQDAIDLVQTEDNEAERGRWVSCACPEGYDAEPVE